MARIKYEFSDVDGIIDDFIEQLDDTMLEVGQEAVEKARQEGNYRNRTGRLRSSNKAEVGRSKGKSVLKLFNDAMSPEGHHYASDVEARGYTVLSSQALWADSELQKRIK